ncbi:MAG: hypothetical protein II781_05370 [Clostridia bacterium]|nr:hypothetical protein [Clostridia bacterium]
MKAAVIQPFYSLHAKDLEQSFTGFLRLCDQCDDSMDLIVFPEYCDIPSSVPDAHAFAEAIQKYNGLVRE